MLRAAKETISLAEQRLLEDDKRQFDSAWQEMLNHATQRVIQTCPSMCLFHILCPPVVYEAKFLKDQVLCLSRYMACEK